jgi:bile-acid 7alpha-dehydratase
MPEAGGIEARIRALEDIEAIKQLKAKYFRCLDNKQWDELSDCFTEHATTHYADGEYQLNGRDQIMTFLKAGLGRSSFFGFHQGHHPEIELITETTAKGAWSSHYYMIDTDQQLTMQCGCFYHDTFEKEGGRWRISSVGYTRIFEEQWQREGMKGLSLNVVKSFPDTSA